MKKFGIYVILNLITRRAYIGQVGPYRNTNDSFAARKGKHWNCLARKTHDNRYLQASCNKNGIENFRFDILEQITNAEFLTAYEQSYIDYYASLPGGIYNLDGPADSPNLGRKFSEEHKRKIGESHKRRWTNLSKEEIKEISDARKQEWANRTPEQVARTRAAMRQGWATMSPEKASEMKKHREFLASTKRGVPLSEEHKKKCSDALKGRTFSEEHKQKIGEATRKRAKKQEQ